LVAPLLVPERWATAALALAAFAFVKPFTEGGVYISLLLTRLPYRGGWLYAADLCGAAIGCLGVIVALLVVDPVSATLWIGSFAAGAGWIVARGGADGRSLRLSGVVALALAASAGAHTALSAFGASHLGVFWAKGKQQNGTLFERWNTFYRVRVTSFDDNPPLGWGFAHAHPEKVSQDYLDIDADAGTVITRNDGDISKLSGSSEATEFRILTSVLLLTPPTFWMGMMFPLGLSVWRRHSELLPFFWSANGITSMLASVLGMALSIEFGIARTYALGACCYVLCAVMIVVNRQTERAGAPAPAAGSNASPIQPSPAVVG
jgi:hypothetical protein